MFKQQQYQLVLAKLSAILVCAIGIINFNFMLPGHALTPVGPERPIIGILSQTITDKLIHKYFPYSKKKSYIATSYVKFVQAGGARVVPILDTYDSKNLTRIFSSLNGLLLPGGGSNLKNSKYMKAIRKLLKLAIKQNEDGGYFPVFGICLGFEAMHVFFEKKRNFLSELDVENKSLPIKFDKTYRTSRLFFNMSKELRNALQNKPITPNFHHEGIHPSWYKRSSVLAKEYRLLATSLDRKSRPFIAAMEGENEYKYELERNYQVVRRVLPVLKVSKTVPILIFRCVYSIVEYMWNIFLELNLEVEHPYSQSI